MRRSQHKQGQEGFVLVTTLLLLLLLSTVLLGLYFMTVSEQRLSSSDEENALAFYAAEAGMEKLTVDIAQEYARRGAPTLVQLQALTTPAFQPPLPQVQYTEYLVEAPTNADGTPVFEVRNISGGPNEGLVASIIPMTLTVTARRPGGVEVKISRSVEVALIPVFQFGIFSETDLSFFAGPNFNFGGRVHTNGNLFLAEGTGSTLTLAQRVTAVGEVVRQQKANGTPTTNQTGTVNAPVVTPCPFPATANCRNLQVTEGSVTGGLGSPANPNWPTISLTTYNGNIRNGLTGARPLNLAFITPGAQPIEIIRRPPAGEDPNSLVGLDRFFNKAQIRILMSDTQADIGGGGMQLANVPPYFNGGAYGATNTAFGEGRTATDANFIPPPGNPPGQPWPLIGGWLKVEALQGGAWIDVTAEWLDLGIAVENPNAILRFQRLADRNGDGDTTDAGEPGAAPPLNNTTIWFPLNLYDTREGEVRDNRLPAGADNTVAIGGVMNIVELNVNNLRRWLTGALGGTGATTEQYQVNRGYILYYSDRRGNRDAANNETGEYGFEDIINSALSTGLPDGVMEAAEDYNGNGTLELYGDDNLGPAYGLPANTPPTTRVAVQIARKNRVLGFRRALKLVNGTLGNLPMPGFTIGSENPVYIQGDYNASTAAGFGDPHSAASILADRVQLLSNSWQDLNSFRCPTRMSTCDGTASLRNGTTTWYRVALSSGKHKAFPWPAAYLGPYPGPMHDFGTDGGMHNFLGMLENWSGQTLNYRGSMISFYYSRQSLGVYKCCSTVYSPPTRAFAFDTDFLNPALLPPGTPTFRDVVNLGFRQVFTVD